MVPSDTESVVALVGLERLVGRTQWCEEPVGAIDRVPTFGGTKNLDVEGIVALRPDLVLANKEENSRRDVERLIEAGLAVYVSFPCTVDESLSHLEILAEMLDAPVPARPELPPPPMDQVRVFAPVWKDPWMTFDERTYASDLLARLGAENVFAGRARRYPLAADVGDASPRDPGERDTRYPRASFEEIRARRPDLVLLPDEPFRFEQSHVDELRQAQLAPRVELVSGKDLFWYGVRTPGAIERLRDVVCRY